METSLTYEIAGGSLALWLDEAGAIKLRVREHSSDAVELAEHEALGLHDLVAPERIGVLRLLRHGASSPVVHPSRPERIASAILPGRGRAHPPG